MAREVVGAIAYSSMASQRFDHAFGDLHQIERTSEYSRTCDRP
ncbi:hypothetical protein I552_5256 [Mycobacterium xenopi 3993]|nr:hypothetical protein I552_5256 [Mycobacterium xenopi 3993]